MSKNDKDKHEEPGLGARMAKGTGKLALRGAGGAVKLAGKGTYRGGKKVVSAGFRSARKPRRDDDAPAR
ncbi:MAG TPA: hypothetical protein VHX88_03230 [Solirubrobacteraceae bacterium]|jgi:hypothetical protein|nr:hypothetical protein [Solirubrobacteraceae bacterium]